MFLPNLMPINAHHLWLNPPSSLASTQYHKSHPKRLNNNNSNNPNYSSSIRASHPAPPLSAYSSACVGATVPVSSNTSSSSNPHFQNIDNHNLIFSNEIEARLNHLDSLKTFGYSTLVPLGIGKTMQNIIDERKLELQEAEASLMINGNNIVTATTTENGINNGMIFSNNNTETMLRNNTQPQDEGTNSRLDLDLDNQLPNHDDEVEHSEIDSNNSENYMFEDDQVLESDNEGFMADEEDYEEDNFIQPNLSNNNINNNNVNNNNNRNISTSTRISSINNNNSRVNQTDSLQINNEIYSSFSRNTTHEEESDMEMD